VDLDLVVAALQTLEKNGLIEIVKVEPKSVAPKKKGVTPVNSDLVRP
jgi:hypothetical protein